MPRILAISDRTLGLAASALSAGEVVAFPTETVYGLGADTFSAAALDRLYALKGRPLDNPLIAHVDGAATAAARLAADWDRRAAALAERFWPGPLTLVVHKASGVPDRATAGRPTVAVRAPAHPVARRLIERFGSPVSAASANRSGRVSPTSAGHVAEEFAGAGDLLILDGGSCPVGIESTVLDLTRDPPSVLRPGSVTAEQLRGVIGEVVEQPIAAQDAAPGTSARHYAPGTPAELVERRRLAQRLADVRGAAVVIAFGPLGVPPPHSVLEMPIEADAYAERLYAALRAADARGAERILIEAPPHGQGLWASIHDRLRRATT